MMEDKNVSVFKKQYVTTKSGIRLAISYASTKEPWIHMKTHNSFKNQLHARYKFLKQETT